MINAHPNSAAAQRTRLLQQLLHGPMSTLDARAVLDVLHPAARIMELRAQGYTIETLRTRERSACGALHRVARYTLLQSNEHSSSPSQFGRSALSPGSALR